MMKVVILAGGFGTRISEESEFKPKPMIEIGGMPILWHIMKGFSSQVCKSNTFMLLISRIFWTAVVIRKNFKVSTWHRLETK